MVVFAEHSLLHDSPEGSQNILAVAQCMFEKGVSVLAQLHHFPNINQVTKLLFLFSSIVLCSAGLPI